MADLKRKVEDGKIQLKFDSETGYLPALLQALNVPIESQMAVFSKTSLQAARIEPGNPRTIFFNDAVAVAWVHGGFIEMAAQDPEQGLMFYTVDQQFGAPRFIHRDDCLSCHRSDISLGVPGMIVRSFYTMPDGGPKLILGGFITDHRSPLEERWGGWYVTAPDCCSVPPSLPDSVGSQHYQHRHSGARLAQANAQPSDRRPLLMQRSALDDVMPGSPAAV